MSELETKLVEFFKRHKQVRLAYLYGSVATGKPGKLSDIDIAVYFDESLGKKERFDQQLRLASELAGILKTNKVDLVVMNDAPISLQYEIIKANHPLLVRDEVERIDLEHRILSRYLDRRYYDKRWTDEFLKKVAKKGI